MSNDIFLVYQFRGHRHSEIIHQEIAQQNNQLITYTLLLLYIYKMQYFILEKIQHQNNRIDNIEKTLLHIYCCMLLIMTLIMYMLLI